MILTSYLGTTVARVFRPGEFLRKRQRFPDYADALPLLFCSSTIFCAIISASVFLETLPNGDNGKSRIISNRSGNLYFAISLASKNSFNSPKFNSVFSRNNTHGHARCVLHRWMRKNQVFDFLGANLFTAAID